MGRSPCCDKNGLKKGPWTAEEDTKLTQYIQTNGAGNWRMLPKNAGLQRCGKSCRLRWTNYLRPDIKRGRFSFDEEETIIQLHSVLGNKWSAIAARLPGRTDNEIKNYWNTHIRRRLLKMGIDPVTHAPRLDYFDLSSLLGSSQLGLSSLLGLQTLLNPQALRLALSLLPSSQSENHDNIWQKLLENQLINQHIQSQAPGPQPNTFDNMMMINQQIPFSMDSTHSTGQIFQENLTPTGTNTTTCDQSLDTNYYNLPGLTGTEFSDISSLQMLINNNDDNNNSNNSNNDNQKFDFDSVISTPLSSPDPLSSSLVHGNGILEEERGSFYSDPLRFEIPEGLDFADFM